MIVLGDLLRGFALWVLCLTMFAATAYLAYMFGLVSYERRDHMPIIFGGFLLAGVVTLILFFIAMRNVQ